MKTVIIVLLAGVVIAGASPALAFQAELERYWRARDNGICRTGITPELISLYEAAEKALDAANYGAGRQQGPGVGPYWRGDTRGSNQTIPPKVTTNFAGLEDLTLTYANCFQTR